MKISRKFGVTYNNRDVNKLMISDCYDVRSKKRYPYDELYCEEQEHYVRRQSNCHD